MSGPAERYIEYGGEDFDGGGEVVDDLAATLTGAVVRVSHERAAEMWAAEAVFGVDAGADGCVDGGADGGERA